MEDPALLDALLLDGRGGARPLDWEAARAWKSDEGALWLNLDYSTAEVVRWLDQDSGIDPLMLSALIDSDPRPRASVHGDALLLIVRGINLNEGAAPEDMISVRTWIEPRRIITLHRRISRSLRGVAIDLEGNRGPRNVGDLIAAYLDRNVEHVSTRVDQLGDAVAACEDQILGETRPDLRATLADLRRRAIALRRFLGPQREALARLTTVSPSWLEPSHRARFVEAADRLTRSVEELDAARDRASVTQEELSSRVGEATNRRLYFLSLITAVFMPLSFVCALLGVNIGGMPFLHDDWAFWALCALFGVGVATMLYVFKRRGWM